VPTRGRERAWRWALGVALVLAVAYPLMDQTGQIVTFRVVGLLAVVGVLAGVRMHGLPPLPWVLIALGQLSFVLGDAVWDVYDLLLHQPPTPSPADVLYLGGYPLVAAGLAVLARRRRAGADTAGLIDATIITIGAGVVAWVFLLSPYTSDATLTSHERLTALAYPLGDVLLLSMAARLFLLSGVHSRGQRLFGFGLVALLLADVAYLALTTAGSTAISGDVMDAGYLISYGLIGASALDPTIRRPDLGPAPRAGLTPARMRLLAAASLLAPATLAVQALTGGTMHALLIASSSAVLFLLVLLRMAGLVRRVEEQAGALARAARTDALTGLLNRRAWDEQLPTELARAERTGARTCIALLDLDRFKGYNDLAGHQAGDRLLRAAAAAWRRELRTVDVLARYGGEEFGLVLPGCGPDEALAIVDRLRALTPEGQTSSAGIAEWDGVESADVLVARADHALYAAKRGGRDRTVLAALDVAA
jgi:diguanylate cyclase (GGDEF)-like protein